MNDLHLMVTIIDRHNAAKFTEFYQKHGVEINLLTVGRGTAISEMLDYFGLEASEKAVLFSTVFSLTHRLTSIAVHFLLWCFFCTLFLAVFTIIVNTFGLAFKLPVIGWVDKLGGAALGAVECGVVLFILGWFANLIGFTVLHDMGSGTVIYSLFF